MAEMLLDAYDAGGLIKAAVSVMRDPQLTLTAKNQAIEEHLASIKNVLTVGPSPPDSLATAYSLLVATNTHAEEAFLQLLASAPAEDIALVREAEEELELALAALDDFDSELETFMSGRAPGHCPSELIEPRS